MLASAVMLGCASENAALQLIEVFGDAISDPTEKAKYAAEISNTWMISSTAISRFGLA